MPKIIGKISNRLSLFLFLFILLCFFSGCAGKDGTEIPQTDKDETPSAVSSSSIPAFSEPEASDIKPPDDKKISGNESAIPVIKTKDFDQAELFEIKRDGYLSYYYRRKYTPVEIKTVWNAINAICPQYSKEEKLQAARSVLAYHWVVYKTTFAHNMNNNVGVTAKYRDLIRETSKLHQIPPEMVEAVITWENSGGVNRRSWAACVGVGQLSMGAVHTAHAFYTPYLRRHKQEAARYKALYRHLGWNIFLKALEVHQVELDKYDLAEKHKRLRKKLKIDDERLIPECNIEDAVVYLKLLYGNYGNRMDLAISAYHNGGLNNNDILKDYIKRVAGGIPTSELTQTEIIDAIKKYNISYISLWNDYRSREMMNGLRTVFGDVTGAHNGHLALGDESDIYPWKVIAAWGSQNVSTEVLNSIIDRYRGSVWDYVECKGMKIYDSYDSIKEGIDKGRLVRIPKGICSDAGLGKFEGMPADYVSERKKFNYYITPEMAGFLKELSEVYRGRTKNPKVRIPLRNALNSKALETSTGGLVPERMRPHMMGVSVEIALDKAPYRDKLIRILNEFYLHDHIFFARNGDYNRITLNPRFGKYYYQKYMDKK
ncbi:MAG: transglycosylase SLT domain-containing protein [Firmicutes bacterium]|nr:transglycosylase SLT domain-containing protein [Bacillota bacterium]